MEFLSCSYGEEFYQSPLKHVTLAVSTQGYLLAGLIPLGRALLGGVGFICSAAHPLGSSARAVTTSDLWPCFLGAS